MSGPSRDRVHFRLPDRSTSSSFVTVKAAAVAFNTPEKTIKEAMRNQTTLIVRPSQFARFLIYRNELGAQNTFKDLYAELRPAEETLVTDLSGQQHDPCLARCAGIGNGGE